MTRDDTLQSGCDKQSKPIGPLLSEEQGPADPSVLPGDPEPAPTVSNVFGSFWIDETEFALPVDVVREVVNQPENLTQVPLSPPHIIGLFSLRKMIVPVVDLRKMLGFPDYEKPAARKVAIIENGDLCVGLLFDDTGGVLNGAGVPRVDFLPTEEGERNVVVEGVLKLEDGARMVQLLDPFEVLRIEKLPRLPGGGTDEATKSHLGPRKSCISFQLGHTTCAIDLRYVQEIMDVPEIQKSHIAYGHILGNIDCLLYTSPSPRDS